jgi:formylglycine-generating enzyme
LATSILVTSCPSVSTPPQSPAPPPGAAPAPAPAASSASSAEVTPALSAAPIPPVVVVAPEPPADAALTCPAGTVWMDGGTFRLGAHPETMVTVKPFCMDLTEVTAAAYATCVSARQCTTEHVGEVSDRRPQAFKADRKCNYGVANRGDHPMNCVDWTQSAAYCRARGARLPSEEEWEWAARGGPEGRVYPWGNALGTTDACWSGITKRSGTCSVGSSPSSDAPGGIHDLLGNVWEWTSSPFTIWLTTGKPDTPYRIARGGGWSTKTSVHFLVALRNWRPPEERVDSLGFRCVR